LGEAKVWGKARVKVKELPPQNANPRRAAKKSRAHELVVGIAKRAVLKEIMEVLRRSMGRPCPERRAEKKKNASCKAWQAPDRRGTSTGM